MASYGVPSSMNEADSHALLNDVRNVLAAERDSACLLDTAGRILFCNEAWDRFAVANGGAPGALAGAVVGRLWSSCLVGTVVVQEFSTVLGRALAGDALSVATECNTADVGRILMCQFQPVQAVPGAPVRGVAIIYNVIRSVPIAQLHEPHPPDDRLYIDARGLMHMCAVCRRVRRGDAPDHRWDFVPAYVEQPRKNTSHGFCGTCFGIKYGAAHLAL